VTFNRKVTHCEWDDATQLWTVTTDDGVKQGPIQ
jgi:cation diffusion facilitator CzcD-associated flavoprotein CzcO